MHSKYNKIMCNKDIIEPQVTCYICKPSHNSRKSDPLITSESHRSNQSSSAIINCRHSASQSTAAIRIESSLSGRTNKMNITPTAKKLQETIEKNTIKQTACNISKHSDLQNENEILKSRLHDLQIMYKN